MTKDKAIEVARPYFEGGNKADTLHVTSDGLVFTQEQYADAHTTRLPDKKVHAVTRDEALGTLEIQVEVEVTEVTTEETTETEVTTEITEETTEVENAPEVENALEVENAPEVENATEVEASPEPAPVASKPTAKKKAGAKK